MSAHTLVHPSRAGPALTRKAGARRRRKLELKVRRRVVQPVQRVHRHTHSVRPRTEYQHLLSCAHRAHVASAHLAVVVVLTLHTEQLVPPDAEDHRLILSLADAERRHANVRRAVHCQRGCRCPCLPRCRWPAADLVVLKRRSHPPDTLRPLHASAGLERPHRVAHVGGRVAAPSCAAFALPCAWWRRRRVLQRPGLGRRRGGRARRWRGWRALGLPITAVSTVRAERAEAKVRPGPAVVTLPVVIKLAGVKAGEGRR